MSDSHDKRRRESQYIAEELRRTKKDRYIYVAIEVALLILGGLLMWYFTKR